MRRLCGGLALALAVALSMAPAARAAEPSPQLVAVVRALQADDARINAIGFRLASVNSAFCPDVRQASGLLLLDAAAFNVPSSIRLAMALKGDFAVEAVAPRSPAERAGIRPGEELLAIDGRALAVLSAGIAPQNQVRLGFLHDEIETALDRRGQVSLQFAARTVDLRGVPACHAHFELATSGNGAQAGFGVVLMSRALLYETRNDDEAAFVLAHELSHLVLGHQQRRKQAGKSRKVTLETEREADRLAAWLMANAGYDAATAPAFLRRRGAKGLAALFPEGSHDSAPARARLVEAELAEMGTAPTDGEGRRDWRARFIRPQASLNRFR
ncbi:MAG: M48 family metalloprotease [Novosphingobium sp.]